ncbi:MAG: hypothetical protein EOO46_15830 [Flavobacterium sp.]|nr:MAG: hypothetical protein EOO46_15830 [Flavobacterium sp.]
MKKLVVLLFFCLHTFGQEIKEIDSVSKNNPILFTEVFGGGGGSSNGGVWLWGLNLNYQFNKKDLLTARYSGIAVGKKENLMLGPFTAIPVFVRKETQQEFALLYGKRWIDDNFSWSVSTGISHTFRDYYQEDYAQRLNDNYLGVPFEFSIKWFKSEKSRFRAYYWLIPIGKRKVSFGRSFGFKFTGNVAKTSYFGFGISYGYGWHKKY